MKNRILGAAGLLSAALVIAFLGVIVARRSWNRALVRVVNKSDRAFSDVRIRLDEERLYTVREAPPGVTVRVRVFPRGESAVTFQAKNADGDVIEGPEQYVEAGGGYILDYVMLSSTTIESDVKLGGILTRLNLLSDR